MSAELIQGTDAWLAMRRNYIMASDTPSIMGVGFKTPYQVWEDKMGLSEPIPDNYAMQRGRELEPVARKLYEEVTGNKVEPKVLFHKTIDYMGASFDGVSEDLSIALEVKCLGKKDHNLAKQGIIPEKYYPQLQHQLAVIDLDVLHYFSYSDDGYEMIEVRRNDSFLKKMYNDVKRFWKYVETLSPPPMSDRDLERRHDLEWLNAATSWLKIKEKTDILKADLQQFEEEEKITRETLINLANNKNSIGSGVRVKKVVSKGRVDYSKIPELEKINLDKYRKNDTLSWRIEKSIN